jgi:3D (Asp-Asp-Asp) domain-containing protein
MNGIAAILTPSRLIRGGLILGCCVLSVSLIGASHNHSFDDCVVRMPVVQSAPNPNQATAEPVLADYRIPRTERTLTVIAPASVQPPKPLPTIQSFAATMLATVDKLLTTPVVPPPAAAQWKVTLMEVTAYCPCKRCCGPRAQGLTASGRPVSVNGGRFVAADRSLSFNTKLLVPGYADGQAVPVLDRGGAIKGNKLDVYFPTHEQAKQWGRRWVQVTVLE